MVQERHENNAFYDRLIQDLSDIETINTRVERDVEFKIQQRISKFGKDGRRILGIHIHVPIEKTKEPFERLAQQSNREQQLKDDLFFTQ